MVNLKNKPFQTERLYKFIKNINLKKKIIGCYYPVNFEANIIELIKKLSTFAGHTGIAGGQELDLRYERKNRRMGIILDARSINVFRFCY